MLKAHSVAVEALEPTTAKRERTERQIAFSSAEAKFEIGPTVGHELCTMIKAGFRASECKRRA